MKSCIESRPLRKQYDREQNVVPMETSSCVWCIGLVTTVALIACLTFSIFFYRGLSGFSNQVNAFVSVGDFSSIFLQSIIFVLSAVFIIYLLFIHLASAGVFGSVLSICGSPCNLLFSSIASQGFLILWVLMLCFVSSVFLVYFLFMGSVYSFCALIDQQCFDFRVLVPAVVSKLSNKKVDLTFCTEKKELLCSQQNNQISNFLAAFLCCLLTFGATLFLENCVVYRLGKRQAAKQQKSRDRYEMKTLG